MLGIVLNKDPHFKNQPWIKETTLHSSSTAKLATKTSASGSFSTYRIQDTGYRITTSLPVWPFRPMTSGSLGRGPYKKLQYQTAHASWSLASTGLPPGQGSNALAYTKYMACIPSLICLEKRLSLQPRWLQTRTSRRSALVFHKLH